MKKLILITSLVCISIGSYNNSYDCLYINEQNPLCMYDKLIYAVNMVEAKVDSKSFDVLAFNSKENACGAFQIRGIRLLDYNKRTGSTYELIDMFDYSIAKKIFIHFALPYGNDFENIARKWNGSGKMTDEYWKKISYYL